MSNQVDRRLMRKKARELGVPEERIDEVLSSSDDELELLEAATVTHSFFASLMQRQDIEKMRIGRDELDNGLEVSTMITVDCGPETAIIDAVGNVHPVERYATDEYAEAGHQEWVKKMKDSPKTIQPLGWVAMMDMDEVELIYP